jgi:hypothetical protein
MLWVKETLIEKIMSEIDMHSMLKRSGLQSTIDSIRTKKNYIDKQMRRISRDLRRADNIDYEKVEKYQKLNQDSRRIRIFEAELMYLRNII